MNHQHATLAEMDAVAAAPSGARMECGVCWYVYDPAHGDDVWQIAPGTPFAALPAYWRCPECDAEQSRFLALDGAGVDARTGGAGDVAAVIAAYQRVDQERMQDLPFRNANLGVEAVDFTPWEGGLLGVVITPWFMNLVHLAGGETDWSAHKHGDLVLRELPSGRYEFIHGELEGFGALQSCSLLSPVTEFADMDGARATAREVMRLMFEPPAGDTVPQGEPLKTEPEPAPTRASGELTRRELLRGRRDAAPGT